MLKLDQGLGFQDILQSQTFAKNGIAPQEEKKPDPTKIPGSETLQKMTSFQTRSV